MEVLPTKDEQLALSNAQALLRSNLLNLQVTELLSTVKAGSSASKKMEAWLEELSETITASASFAAGASITEEWLKKNKLDYFALRNYDSRKTISLNLASPASVQTIGSFALGTMTSPFLSCDLAVTFPDECLEDRDILNHTYFDKRRLYLAVIAKALTDAGVASSVKASDYKCDERKPFIVVKPNYKTKFSVRIFVATPTEPFKLSQLRGTKNNVRPQKWMQKLASSSGVNKQMDVSLLSGTPGYNMAIMEDMAISAQYRLLSTAMNACGCLRDACVLFKVWLTQKSVRFAFDGLDGHTAQLLVVFLFQAKRFSAHATAVAAFQAILSFLTEVDLTAVELDLSSGTMTKKIAHHGEHQWPATLNHPISLQQSSQNIQYNAFWRLSQSTLKLLKREATFDLHVLQSGIEEAFQLVFLERRDSLLRDDLVFHIPLKSTAVAPDAGLLEGISDSWHAAQEELSLIPFATEKVFSLVEKALSDRVLTVCTSVRVDRSHLSGDETVVNNHNGSAAAAVIPDQELLVSGLNAHKKWTDSLVVTVSLTLDNDHAKRRVDRGPNADDTEEAVQFREFWGAKSSLRRFQDGAIVDAVVWESTRTSEKMLENVLRYLLGRHLPMFVGGDGARIVAPCQNLETLLPAGIREDSGSSPSSSSSSLSASSAPYLQAITELDKLRTVLASRIKDLPLIIDSVIGLSAQLRYTALLPPAPNPLLLLPNKEVLRKYNGHAMSLFVRPMMIMAELEGSGKWPQNRDASEKLKSAFLLQLSDQLQAQFKIYSQPYREYLDIHVGGFVYRLVLVVPSELALSRSIRAINALGQHHQAIRALQAKHETYADSVRLALLWLSKQQFSGIFSQRHVELLVAAVFLTPAVHGPPTTSFAGFLRTLRLLSKHEFTFSSPLVVDFDGTLTAADREAFAKIAVEGAGTAAAADSPSSSPLFFSSCDKGATPATLASSDKDKTVDRTVLSLIQSRAADCADKFSTMAMSTETSSAASSSLESIFDSGREALSARFNLKFKFPGSLQCKSKDFLLGPKVASMKLYSNSVSNKAALEEKLLCFPESNSCNPVQEDIVAQLREKFGHVALFFWDDTIGDQVGVILKPAAFLPANFSALGAKSVTPLLCSSNKPTAAAAASGSAAGGGVTRVFPDISSLAAEFYLVGGGRFSDIIFQ